MRKLLVSLIVLGLLINWMPMSAEADSPTVTISNVPSGTQTSNFTVTITFSETVDGFTTSDIKLNPSTLASPAQLSGSDGDTTFTLQVNPTVGQSGILSIWVPANAVTATTGGEANWAAQTVKVTIDTQKPTPTIGAVTVAQSDDFMVSITFDEDVINFAASDISLSKQSGTAGGTVSSVTGSGDTYSATISPTGTGTLRISIPAGGATDNAGNTNNVSSNVDVSVDTEAPTPTITAPTTPQNDTFDVRINFGESVTGFVKNDITLGGTATYTSRLLRLSHSFSYVLRITPTASGTVTIDVPADVAEDIAGNSNTAATQASVSIDTIPPTVAISDVPTTEQNAAFDLTITFSEDVTGFATDDLTVTGDDVAAVTSVSGSGSDWTATITPNDTSEGGFTVTVNADAAMDAAGNGNTVSAATGNIHVDTIRPKVAISDVPTTEQNGAFDVTVTFSEDVADNFAVWVNGHSSFTTVLSGSGSSWTATITPEPNKEEDVTLEIVASTTFDAAGNENTASAETSEIHIDTIPPTVVIEDVPDIEKNVPYDLTVRFSEAVNGFSVADDLTVTLTAEEDVTSNTPIAAVTLKSGAEGDAVYVVTVTPHADGAEGDVAVTVNANAVQDMATNANTAGSNTATVHIDTIPPTVAISDVPTTEQNAAFDLTITFSEDVTGFAAAGLTVTGPATATLSGSGSGYTATITPNATAEGDVTVQVSADAVVDAAGNNNPASDATDSIHVDTIPPTATISDVPTTEQNSPFDLTITFNEEVTGFAVAGLTVTGPATATLSGSGSGYTATITPNATAEGDVTVQVSADAVVDAAGNNNPASDATDSIHIDTIPPTIVFRGVPDTEQNGAFDLGITFSEEITGFAMGDLTVTGEATATAVVPVGTNNTYIATITPTVGKEGDVTVTVNASAVTDAAGNKNTASEPTRNIHIDTIAPTVSVAVTPLTVEANGYETEERNAPYDLTVTFSEEVNGFALSDLAVTGPGSATALEGSDGDIVYTVTVTPDADAEGDVTVAVNASTVQDFATNQNPAGSAPITVYIDTIAPTFTIEDTPVLQKINDFFDIRIVFSEAVNDFRPADFTASDLVTPSLQSGADGASEYTVRMTPNEDVQGNLFIEVSAETAQDFALNLNADAVATTQPVRIDTIAPTVEISDLPTGVRAEPFDVTITFAEAVNGFTTEDIALVGPATVLLTAGTDGDAVYTASVAPTENADGNVTLQIPAAVVEDLAGNVNLASDLTRPIPINTSTLIVELQDVPDTVQLDAFSVMIVFSKDVEDFVLGDIEITGDAVVQSSTLLGLGNTYNLTVTPDENTDGDVIITIPAGVAQDAAGKSNAASVPQTVAVAPIWMPDASLRAAFRELLGLSEGEDFTQQQLRTITTLEAGIIDINDLKGAEQATGLTTLVIPGNGITDITSLRRLTQLTTLNLADNAVTDLTPLSGLTELTSLNLSGNGLTSIAALEDLTSLTTLDLSNNALTDISVLANFTKTDNVESIGQPHHRYFSLGSPDASHGR